MAADDITLAEFHFEGPTSPASFGVHYQETTGISGNRFATRELVEALLVAVKTPIVSVLSNDWHFTAITVRIKSNDNEPFVRSDITAGIGLRAGPALPANMAWIIKQGQATFPAKSNGRIYIPGLGEADSLIGVITNVFLVGAAKDLADAFALDVNQTSAGTGIWAPGVISRKVLNANPPVKDWAGAFAPIQTMTAWTIISSQRRRRTRAIGAAQG